MVGIDTSENLTPFRDAGGKGAGAILFDATRLRQANVESDGPHWFDPTWWGKQAAPVSSGGRGGAWFVNLGAGSDGKSVAGFDEAVLRHYLRGGVMARLSRDRHLWCGPAKIRSFDEFRLLRELRRRGLPVPEPIAAIYWRGPGTYRAAILLERLRNVQSLADLSAAHGAQAPWEHAGQLIAKFHRAGLDHVDLNAHNILFDDVPHGWLIDLDRSRVRIPATAWREANLARLHRSLLKLRGTRSVDEIHQDYLRLKNAYDAVWQRGV